MLFLCLFVLYYIYIDKETALLLQRKQKEQQKQKTPSATSASVNNPSQSVPRSTVSGIGAAPALGIIGLGLNRDPTRNLVGLPSRYNVSSSVPSWISPNRGDILTVADRLKIIERDRSIVKPRNWNNSAGWIQSQLSKCDPIAQYKLFGYVDHWPAHICIDRSKIIEYPELDALRVQLSTCFVLPKKHGDSLVETVLVPSQLPSNIRAPEDFESYVAEEFEKSKSCRASDLFHSRFTLYARGLSLNYNLAYGDSGDYGDLTFAGIIKQQKARLDPSNNGETARKIDNQWLTWFKDKMTSSIKFIESSDLDHNYYHFTVQEQTRRVQLTNIDQDVASQLSMPQMPAMPAMPVIANTGNEVTASNNATFIAPQTHESSVPASTSPQQREDTSMREASNSRTRQQSSKLNTNALESEDDATETPSDSDILSNGDKRYEMTGEIGKYRRWLVNKFGASGLTEGWGSDIKTKNKGWRRPTPMPNIFLHACGKLLRNFAFVQERPYEKVTGILIDEIETLDGKPFAILPVPVLDTDPNICRRRSVTPRSLWTPDKENGGCLKDKQQKAEKRHGKNKSKNKKESNHPAKQYGDSHYTGLGIIKCLFIDSDNQEEIDFYLSHSFLDDKLNLSDENEYPHSYKHALKGMLGIGPSYLGFMITELYFVLCQLIHANGSNLLNKSDFIEIPKIKTSFLSPCGTVQMANGFQAKKNISQMTDDEIEQLVLNCGTKFSISHLFFCVFGARLLVLCVYWCAVNEWSYVMFIDYWSCVCTDVVLMSGRMLCLLLIGVVFCMFLMLQFVFIVQLCLC